MENEAVRQKYLELQMAAEQMKQIHSHLQTIEAKSQELEVNVKSLESIRSRSNSGILAPIFEGIFLKAELKSDTDVIINVGAGVCVNKTVDEAAGILRGKQEELSQYAKEMAIELEMAAEGVRKLEEELNNAVKSARQENV